MAPTPRQIGMKIKKLRKARKMSQEKLAVAARVSRGYLARLEAGQHDPTVGTVQRLAKALGVPVTELLG